jgi:hypothetical protein
VKKKKEQGRSGQKKDSKKAYSDIKAKPKET